MKFYEFKNITDTSASLYIYGAIVWDHDDWFGSDTDVSLLGFKSELDKIGNIKNLDIFINSPGGDVFAASTMISLLERIKDNGTYITAYVDGLSASAASFLMMMANEIKLYKNSVVMVHKPMSVAVGNVNDIQKTIDALNKIEDSVMMPMYMSKAKSNEDEIKNLIDVESWLDASEMDKHFNVTLLEDEKLAVANVNSKLFKNYHNIPDSIKSLLYKGESGESDDIGKESLESEENTQINETEKEEENQSKEQEIKSKLDFFKCSIILKKIKERGEIK